MPYEEGAGPAKSTHTHTHTKQQQQQTPAYKEVTVQRDPKQTSNIQFITDTIRTTVHTNNKQNSPELTNYIDSVLLLIKLPDTINIIISYIQLVIESH